MGVICFTVRCGFSIFQTRRQRLLVTPIDIGHTHVRLSFITSPRPVANVLWLTWLFVLPSPVCCLSVTQGELELIKIDIFIIEENVGGVN